MKGYPGLTNLLTEHDKTVKQVLLNKKHSFPKYLLKREKKEIFRWARNLIKNLQIDRYEDLPYEDFEK